MSILDQVGINHTVIFQFGIFLVAVSFLSVYVFAPYLKALEAREEKTKGSEEIANELAEQAGQIRSQYEVKAREISTEIKGIFDNQRELAKTEYEKIVGDARSQSQKLITATKEQVEAQLQQAQKELKTNIPVVSSAITQKLLSR